MLEKIQQLSFLKLFKNLYSLMKYNIHQDIFVLKKDMQEVRAELNEFDSSVKNKILIANIQQYYGENPELRINYETELSYLINNPNDLTFPYKRLKRIKDIVSGYDEKLLLPYIIHNEKRLYFPKIWTENMAVAAYRNFIENENILGGDYKEKTPHQYEAEEFCVKTGDVLLDIGSAEGLFALHNIDKVKKLYLVESDTYWIEALQATFTPYKDKVEIINKLISDVETERSVTLSSILKNELSSSIFVKMDIEGYEKVVLNASEDILSEIQDIRIVACTYHEQNDAEELSKIFDSFGYKIEFSDGYMLFIWDKLQPPYFRKGLIRAKKA
jgi:hypothetical protein